jgi:hypothetical protein
MMKAPRGGLDGDPRVEGRAAENKADECERAAGVVQTSPGVWKERQHGRALHQERDHGRRSAE